MKEKRQIIHIHGGTAFNSRDQYLDSLRKKPLYHMETTGLTGDSWYKKYPEFLGEKYDVLLPPMPSKDNAKYNEWKIWFERHFTFFEENLILIGHSLGGIFLAKYLSENDFPVSIKQLHLVAAPYEDENDVEQLDDFKIGEFPGKLLEKNIPEIHIYHSTDDTVVPVSESEKYHARIPRSQLHIFSDRFHFLDETFPELFDNIKK